ncbi:MAG TPA: hypothetical protein VEP72_08890 [Microbacterium sp.]|nr:hypothetical protein [Microbacterium sp.]
MSVPAIEPADLLAELPALPSRRDAPLHALERPLPRRRPRVLYGVIAVGGALLIGAAQMGLSILTTQSSYELSSLTSQQRGLDYQKQMLGDDVAGLGSPQYLAANAEALGMMVGQPPSYLRLSDSAIVGTGAGVAGASAVNALSKAAVGNALVAGVPLVSDPNASLGAGASVLDDAILNTTTPPAIADGLPTPATH